MLQETSELRPPRLFFAYAALVAGSGLVIGALLLRPQSFRMTINVGVSIATLASGFAQITRPWSVPQRALLLVATGSLGIVLGMIGLFVF